MSAASFWILLIAGLGGLFLTAVGLPGLWIFLAVAVVLKLAVSGGALSWAAILVGVAIAGLAEIIEFVASVRYTSKYGGSKRAGWGALIGGIVGAIVGVPIPLIGSVVGSFAGSFLGALIAEYSARVSHGQAQRVAWGALIGRVVATAAKIGLGCVLIAILLYSAWG
ncbi:MAG: DUF456 family protein [Gemmatimonadales bacterium]